MRRSKPATFADVVRIFDLDTDNPVRGEWRVLGPDELFELCKPVAAPVVPVVPALGANGVCERCSGRGRVAGRVAGLTRPCPDCAARATQLSLNTGR